MTKPVILYRMSDEEDEVEHESACRYFDVVDIRTQVPSDSLVIGRYSVLPYYAELEKDLAGRNARLINNHWEHIYVAYFAYYHDLADYTFKTWFDHDFHNAPEGRYVVKGRTNSRKHQWNSHMFAETKADASRIASELANDPLIGPQGILYREYVPLETFEIGVNGQRFTNEWRFFYYKQSLLTVGYYWTNAQHIPQEIETAAITQADAIAKIASQHVNFFVLDLAKTEVGEWVLVEMNDGQMSGLSDNPPDRLYSALSEHF